MMGLRHGIDIRIAYHPQCGKCNPASFMYTTAFHAHDNIRCGWVFIPVLQMKKASSQQDSIIWAKPPNHWGAELEFWVWLQSLNSFWVILLIFQWSDLADGEPNAQSRAVACSRSHWDWEQPKIETRFIQTLSSGIRLLWEFPTISCSLSSPKPSWVR